MVNCIELTEDQLNELKFTKEEREQLDEARKKPIVYDDDCPPVTPEKAARFKRANPPRSAQRA